MPDTDKAMEILRELGSMEFDCEFSEKRDEIRFRPFDLIGALRYMVKQKTSVEEIEKTIDALSAAIRELDNNSNNERTTIRNKAYDIFDAMLAKPENREAASR